MVRTSRNIIATKKILSFWLGMGVCLMTGAFAFAEANLRVSERSYKVDALTTQGLIFQTVTRGPIGFGRT